MLKINDFIKGKISFRTIKTIEIKFKNFIIMMLLYLIIDNTALAMAVTAERGQNILNIMSINCKNIKSNGLFINEMLLSPDIVFLQEHWLNNKEIDKMEKFINCKERDTHFKSAMNIEQYDRGRPYGSIGWIMRKNIIYKEIIFISDNISVLKIDNQMNKIGVYLNCNQNNTESFNNHLHDVEQLAGILKTISNENVLIIGDFNSDFKRKSKFDKILQQFVKTNNLVIATNINKDISSHITYFGANNGVSSIDHILLNQNAAQNLKTEMRIEEHALNTSDHLSIHYELCIPGEKRSKKKSNKQTKETHLLPQINWMDNKDVDIYRNELQLI